MCGIIGYVGRRETGPILLDALARMEYRGYDSAGLALQNGKGLVVRKLAGRVTDLQAAFSADPTSGHSGIGHTRWATHGAPTTDNAHPHLDCSGTLALVHNGIVENADALRGSLEKRGHRFSTPTDTEVLVHLIEESPGDTLEEKVAGSLSRVEGTYGLAAMWQREPGSVVVARRGSPVLLGIGEDGELFVASDPAAILGHTRSVIYLEDGDVAVLSREGYRIRDLSGRQLHRKPDSIEWDLQAIELCGYDHFMLKEIHEQPESIRNTLRGRLGSNAHLRVDSVKLGAGACDHLSRVIILGCGTSWHAGLIGRHIIERLAGVPVQVEYASEFRYRDMLHPQNTVVVAISQSGETADTLEALRCARQHAAHVVGLVNVVGSSIERECEGVIHLRAGPEIGVASTKAFTSQLVALCLLGLHLSRSRWWGRRPPEHFVPELLELPRRIEETLGLEDEIRELAHRFRDASNFLYLGRGVNFPVALEGALKLKEVSYIHAEGYPAAEMKHGPIALIDEDMPVVVVAPRDDLYTKTLSNLQEVKARGGRTIVVTTPGGGGLGDLADHVITVPETSPLLSPVLTVIPLQLLAYHIAVLRGCDVDRPRNLAKSVTVE